MISTQLGQEPWMSQAACRDEDPEIFFPLSQRDVFAITRAKQICQSCPVLELCRGRALRLEISNGVFGGMDEWEREPLLSRQRQARVEARKAAKAAAELAG